MRPSRDLVALNEFMDQEMLTWADVLSYARSHAKALRTRRRYSKPWRHKNREKLNLREKLRRRRRRNEARQTATA